jgi:hypothetical protein
MDCALTKIHENAFVTKSVTNAKHLNNQAPPFLFENLDSLDSLS